MMVMPVMVNDDIPMFFNVTISAVLLVPTS